jgi:hypothetical protein
MPKRDILCAIWSPNVCSLKCYGCFRAWTAWAIYLLIHTLLSWADEVMASHYCSHLLWWCWQFWHFQEQLWLGYECNLCHIIFKINVLEFFLQFHRYSASQVFLFSFWAEFGSEFDYLWFYMILYFTCIGRS